MLSRRGQDTNEKNSNKACMVGGRRVLAIVEEDDDASPKPIVGCTSQISRPNSSPEEGIGRDGEINRPSSSSRVSSDLSATTAAAAVPISPFSNAAANRYIEQLLRNGSGSGSVSDSNSYSNSKGRPPVDARGPLRRISLAGNELHAGNVAQFASALASGRGVADVTYLAMFHVAACSAGAPSTPNDGGGAGRAAALLAGAVATLPNLRTLAWTGVDFRDGYAAWILARTVRKSQTLRRLSLAGCDIGPVGVTLLADAIVERDGSSCAAAPALEALCLEECTVGDDGAAILADALHGNQTLHTLSLTGTDVGNGGAAALLNALYDGSRGADSIWESNHTVTTLVRSTSTRMTTTVTRSSSYPSTGREEEKEEEYDDNEGDLVEFGDGSVSFDLKRRLAKALEINRSCCFSTFGISSLPSSSDQPAAGKVEATRRKILLRMEESSFCGSGLDCLEVGLLPRVLSWCGRAASFEILRNTPFIFAALDASFESAAEDEETADTEDERGVVANAVDLLLARQHAFGDADVASGRAGLGTFAVSKRHRIAIRTRKDHGAIKTTENSMGTRGKVAEDAETAEVEDERGVVADIGNLLLARQHACGEADVAFGRVGHGTFAVARQRRIAMRTRKDNGAIKTTVNPTGR